MRQVRTSGSLTSLSKVWRAFDEGTSLGERGSEGGSIVLDEEHDEGARITVEEGGYTPWSITCGIYGWMVHTRFFAERSQAMAEVEPMKRALESTMGSDNDDRFSDFVARFPENVCQCEGDRDCD